jgi:hypothetical protein
MMRRLRSILMAIGAVVAFAGTFFLFQGLGVIRWPADSIMVGDQFWVTIGSGVAVIGLFLILLARRLR